MFSNIFNKMKSTECNYINIFIVYCVFLCLLVDGIDAKHEIYDGCRVYSLKINNAAQAGLLRTLESQIELDFWTEPILGRDGIVMIKPGNREYFEEQLGIGEIEYSLETSNVKKLLDDNDRKAGEYRKMHPRFQSITSDRIDLDRYYRYDEIVDYITNLSKMFPNKLKVEEAGLSFEGRSIKHVKISSSNFEDRTKPIIMLDAAVHAREWIAPAVALYLIQQLVVDNAVPDLLNDADWIVVPVVNPDGYEYTHTHERLWRKTRSTNNADIWPCPGVDGNRNYDFAWMEPGASGDPCSLTYAGPTAFSEPETRAVRDIMAENLNRIKLYISLHSYGSALLYPWGNNGTDPDNEADLFKVGKLIGDTIDAMKLPEADNYRVGNSATTLYVTSGASIDYARSIGIPLDYTLELPSFGFGFQLPPNYIEQVVKETWTGISAGAREAIDI